MPNTRSGTAIQPDNYNSRGLFLHRSHGTNKNLIRQQNGVLWALVARSGVNVDLIRSLDNGFSWVHIKDVFIDNVTRSSTNADPHGNVLQLVVMAKWNIIAAWWGTWESVGSTHDIHYAYALLDSDLTDPTNWTECDLTSLDQNEALDGVFCIPHNSDLGYLVYVLGDGSKDLKVRHWSPRSPNTVSTGTTFTGKNFKSIFSASAHEDGYVDIVIVEDASTEVLLHYRYTESGASLSSSHTIDTAPGTNEEIISPSIARDSYGTLCAAWGETNSAGTTVAWRYAYSTNNGSTWTKVDVANETGNSSYTDSVKSQPDIRTEVIGGSTGGFLITYTQDNGSSIPKSYVRRLTTTNGTTYTLGSQELVAPENSTANINGAKFFHPPGHVLMDLAVPGEVRIAWQKDEGDSTVGEDTIPVQHDQELLKYSAYPSPLETETGDPYVVDAPTAGEILVNLEIIPGPTNNIDFYAQGMTGRYTDRYMAAFNRLSTTCRVLQYEPLENSTMGDRSSYETPTEHCVKVVWKPESYRNPTPNVATPEDQTDRVEQDVRKVYFPPDFHLSRDFTRNQGNFLKRTVWIIFFDGNEYELTQVIPHFMNNQICYYETNAYVIGPSRDPFARDVLPSET